MWTAIRNHTVLMLMVNFSRNRGGSESRMKRSMSRRFMVGSGRSIYLLLDLFLVCGLRWVRGLLFPVVIRVAGVVVVDFFWVGRTQCYMCVKGLICAILLLMIHLINNRGRSFQDHYLHFAGSVP